MTIDIDLRCMVEEAHMEGVAMIRRQRLRATWFRAVLLGLILGLSIAGVVR